MLVILNYVSYLTQLRMIIMVTIIFYCVFYLIGSACCTRVLRSLHQLYPTPIDAEKDISINKENSPQLPDSTDSAALDPDGVHVNDLSSTLMCNVPISKTSRMDWFHQLLPLDQTIDHESVPTSCFNASFWITCSTQFPAAIIEGNDSAAKKNGCSNILFGLAKGLGIQRDDGSDSLIPTN